MPDDDEPMMFLPIPEEMQEKLRQHHDKVNMAGEVWRHELRSFLGGLSAENLFTFRILMDNIGSHENPAYLCNYFEGVAVAMLDLKFNMCFGCGQNHDGTLSGMQEEDHDG